MSSRWGKRAAGRWRQVNWSSEVEEAQAQAASQSTAVAVGTAAVAPGLTVTQPKETEDADEETYFDTESVTYTEVGDSRASGQAVNSESEGAAVEGAAVADPENPNPVCSARPLQHTGQI